MTATFFNSTFTETYRKTFILSVWDDIAEPTEPWFPPNPILYKDFDQVNVVRQNTT